MDPALRFLVALAIFCFSQLSALSQQTPVYSPEREHALGRQLANDVERAQKMIDDPVILTYVNRLAQKLSEHCPVAWPLDVRVADSDRMNGDALPGGYLFVNTGLIRHSDSEAEVAAVLAYMIAHVRSGGSLRMAERASVSSFGALPLIFMGSATGFAFRQGAGLAIPAGFLQGSRTLVSEADAGGLHCLSEAGYNPEAFVQVLKNLQAVELNDKEAPRQVSTHPPAAERLERVQAMMASLKPKTGYLTNTPEFTEVKQRVELLYQQRMQRADAPPTLRRN
jgi:beta-barrel assembly-enhancing protease